MQTKYATKCKLEPTSTQVFIQTCNFHLNLIKPRIKVTLACELDLDLKLEIETRRK